MHLCVHMNAYQELCNDSATKLGDNELFHNLIYVKILTVVLDMQGLLPLDVQDKKMLRKICEPKIFQDHKTRGSQ